MSVAPAAPVAATASQRARRDAIVRAAGDLLEDRPYERIQIRHVAEAAGVALGTLYRYFPSKEQLYAEVLLVWSESFDRAGERAKRTPDTDQERLRMALRRAVRAYERHPHFYRLLTVLEVVSDDTVAERFATFASRFTDTLRRTLHDVDERDAATIAMTAGAVLGALLRNWSRGAMSIQHVYDELDRYVHLVFAGVTPLGSAR